MSKDIEDASYIFEELAREVYYGFNMKYVITELTDDDKTVLLKFATKCRKSRIDN